MASKTTLNSNNLRALGAARLTSIARTRSFVDGRGVRALANARKSQSTHL